MVEKKKLTIRPETFILNRPNSFDCYSIYALKSQNDQLKIQLNK